MPLPVRPLKERFPESRLPRKSSRSPSRNRKCPMCRQVSIRRLRGKASGHPSPASRTSPSRGSRVRAEPTARCSSSRSSSSRSSRSSCRLPRLSRTSLLPTFRFTTRPRRTSNPTLTTVRARCPARAMGRERSAKKASHIRHLSSTIRPRPRRGSRTRSKN